MIICFIVSLVILLITGKLLLQLLPKAYSGEVGKGGFRAIFSLEIRSKEVKQGVEYRRFVVAGVESLYYGLPQEQIIEVNCSETPKKGDLVVIKENSQGYKIRKTTKNPDSEGVIETLWYDNKGKPWRSYYTLHDVIGVTNEN